jgi:septation ring formation regulator EzrA
MLYSEKYREETTVLREIQGRFVSNQRDTGKILQYSERYREETAVLREIQGRDYSTQRDTG